MLHKTRGIALQTVKFSETSIIARIYTELFGLQSYLIKGIRKQHPHIKPGLFQPLTILDLTVYHKEKGNLQSLKEVSNHHPYHSLPFDIKKSSVALFINELICKSIREEEPDRALFDFLLNACIELDSTQAGVASFPVLFSLGLTRYLGFYPQADDSAGKEIFNLKEGVFQENLPGHKYYLRPPVSILFKELIQTGEGHLPYSFSGLNLGQEILKARSELLEQILLYYKLHLPDFREVHSHQVLHAILQ